MKKIELKKQCSLCNQTYEEFDCNAWPLAKRPCCKRCDNLYVTPARILGVTESNVPAVNFVLAMIKFGTMMENLSKEGAEHARRHLVRGATK